MLMSSVIAHRGARGQAAENTLRAIELAAEQGCIWVELDVMLTADQVPVIFHDNQLDRLTDGYGAVKDHCWSELQSYKVHPARGSAEAAQPIPSLRQALQVLQRLGLGLNLEIKPNHPADRIKTLQLSLEVLQEFPGVPVVLSSFRHQALEEAQKLAPHLPRAVLWEGLPADWQQKAQTLEVRAVHLAAFALRRGQVAEIRSLGLEVYIYTINSVKQAQRLKSWGVTGVFSDYPERLLQLPGWRSRQLQAYGEVI